MPGLLGAAPRIAEQIEIDAESIRDPYILNLLAEDERSVVPALQQHDVIYHSGKYTVSSK